MFFGVLAAGHAAGQGIEREFSVAPGGQLIVVADDAKLEVRGSGKAFVWAEQRLAASITGNGRVTYRGAAEVESSVQGNGKITQLTPSTEPGAPADETP